MIKLFSHPKPENPKTPYELAQKIYDYLQQQQPWNPNLRPVRLLTPSEEELNLSLPFESRDTVLGKLGDIIRYEMENRFGALPNNSNIVFYKGTRREFIPDVMLDGLSRYHPFIRGDIVAALSSIYGGIELSASHTSAQNSATIDKGQRVPLKEGAILEVILSKDSVRPYFGCISYGAVVEHVPFSAVTGIYLADKDGKWVRFRVRDGEIMDPDDPNSRVQTLIPLTFPYTPESISMLRDDLHQEPSPNSILVAEIEKIFGSLSRKKIVSF